MPSLAILFGRLLILVGIVGYGYGLYAGGASLTAMIPAVFGFVLMALGHLSNLKEDLRKHLMHAAAAVGLIGFLATVSSFLILPAVFSGTAERPAAAISKAVTAALCLAFVVLCVKSFTDARRARIA